MFKNVASVEISELKDALNYAEYLLAQNLQEKEGLLKKDAEHNFEIKKVEDRLRETSDAKKKADNTISELEQKCGRAEESNKMVSACCTANSDLNLKIRATFELIHFMCRCKTKSKIDSGYSSVRLTSERKRSQR